MTQQATACLASLEARNDFNNVMQIVQLLGTTELRSIRQHFASRSAATINGEPALDQTSFISVMEAFLPSSRREGDRPLTGSSSPTSRHLDSAIRDGSNDPTARQSTGGSDQVLEPLRSVDTWSRGGLLDASSRTAALIALFGQCDPTGCGLVSYSDVASFMIDRAANQAELAQALTPFAPYRLDKVVASMEDAPGFGHHNKKDKGEHSRLGPLATIRKLCALPDLGFLAATDSRSANVTMLRLDTHNSGRGASSLHPVGVLRAPSAIGGAGSGSEAAVRSGGASSAGPRDKGVTHATVEAFAGIPGVFSDGSPDPSHSYLVTAASDSTMSLWNLSPVDAHATSAAQFALLSSWPSHYPQLCLTYARKYAMLYSGCLRGPLRAWDIHAGIQVASLEVDEQYIMR
jgi:WD40 repeat protein